MLVRCSPTLLALALGFAPVAAQAASAPSEATRDEHARAIKAVIDLGAKRVAQRQMELWAKLGYADTGSPTVREALQIAFKQAFDPAFDERGIPTGNVPKIVAELTGQGGSAIEQVLRLVNAARRTIDVDGAKPLVLPTTEKIAALQRTVTKLIAVYEKEFTAALAKVAAGKKDEDELWQIDDTKPEGKRRAEEIQRQAVELRLECMQIYYFAHMILREVATRGADFGIDPKPAQTSLNNWAKTNKEILDDWDFQWSEYHPQLLFYIAIAQCEGARQQVKNYAPADCEAGLMKVVDLDPDQVPPGAREAMKTLQIKAWANLLRWELEMGTPASWDRGLALFEEFLSRTKNDRAMGLSAPETERAIAVGQVYLLAGRLNLAKGNSAAAQQLWAQVRASKNPLASVASGWITARGDTAISTNPWAEEPIAADPSSALMVGQALMREVGSASPQQAREFALGAAAGLRNGVLGLSSAAYAEQFVEHAAPIFRNYTAALSKLEMPYHAAAAAHEGLRQIRARINGKSNPWKDKNGAWTQSGQQVNSLINTAISVGSVLQVRTRTPAAKRLFDEIVQLAQQINPELVGKGLEWSLILGRFNEGDYAGCLEDAQAYAKKYPEEFTKAASLILRTRLAWIDKLDTPGASASDKSKLSALQKELDDHVVTLEKYLATELPKAGNDAAKAAPLGQLQIAVASAKIKSKLKQQKYAEVFADLGPDFWKKPPSDPDLGVAMLKMLVQAVHESHMRLSGMEKQDDKPQPVKTEQLAAAWVDYHAAMRTFRKFAPRYGAGDSATLKNASLRLAQVANYVSAQAEQNARAKSGGDGMAEIAAEAKRNFADFVESTLNEKSKPPLVLMVAQTLWELGEKARAARLFEVYKAGLDRDPQIQAFRADPQSVLNPVATLVTARSEFKKPWEEVVDLLSDPPGYLADLIKGGRAAVQDRGEKRDYGGALVKIDALKKLVSDAGYLDAEGKKKIIEALDALRSLTLNLASAISIDVNLAQFYRESGKAEQAVKLYRALYEEYDPLNAVFAAGYVEGVLEAIKTNPAGVDKTVIIGAREVAGQNLRIFTQGNQRDQYWISWLQVLELSKSLPGDEGKVVAKQLQFSIINKSTPRDDLHLPLVPGDDPRVRRAANQGSVAIAQRYLDLFEGLPELKRPFRIEVVEAQGKSVPLFVDTDAPTMVGQVETTADGDEIVLFKAADAAPAPAAQP